VVNVTIGKLREILIQEGQEGVSSIQKQGFVSNTGERSFKLILNTNFHSAQEMQRVERLIKICCLALKCLIEYASVRASAFSAPSVKNEFIENFIQNIVQLLQSFTP